MNQGIAKNWSEFLSYLRSIQVDQHILRGRRGSEENVKTKIVIPLLQAIGWDVLGEMDFECAGADIVLSTVQQPEVIVEVKSWGEEITDYLDQCLEYTLGLNTPWVIITCGQDTALYCSLLNPSDLLATEPLLGLSFEELRADGGEQVLKELNSLVGKASFAAGHRELSRMVSKRLGSISLGEAYKDFEREASDFNREMKSQRMTVDKFFTLTSEHPEGVQEALNSAYHGMVSLAELDHDIRVRYRSKEIGLEYRLTGRPRSKILGLVGIYPGDAHISFGLQNWRELGLSEAMYKRIDGFSRRVESGAWTEQLLELLEAAMLETGLIRSTRR